MQIHLTSFRYYYALEGRSGGLRSFAADLVADDAAGEDAGRQAKAAMMAVMDRYTGLCDRVYDEVLDGERLPLLTDTEMLVRTGYEYKGQYSSNPLTVFWLFRTARKVQETCDRLASIFEGMEPDMRAGPEKHRTHTVRLCFEELKGRGESRGVRANLEFQCDHVLNACFFRFMRACADVAITDHARSRMDALDRTLSLAHEGNGADFFTHLARAD